MSAAAPTTVFGLPVYNGEQHLAEAIESLLGQSRPDFAIVVVDNCSTDGTAEIAQRYADLDPRLAYERNERTIGLVDNWRLAVDSAGRRFPDARFFAWASDHDVWDPRWLELLAAELEADERAVLAYPDAVRIDDAGAEYPTRAHPSPGNMVYGLGRRDAFERAGPFPRVVLPDRLFLTRLALEGNFRRVPRRLWYRRYRAGVEMSNARQRRVTFPDGAPISAYLPWWLHHAIVFGRPGRARLALDSARHAYRQGRTRRQRKRRWRRRERRQQLRPLLGRPEVAAAAPQTDPAPPALETVILDELAAQDATVGVDVFADHPDELARRLHETGVAALYVVERESPALRAALGRWYWLRDVWVPREGSTGRKPDPNTGPVPREPGSYRHLVGRRRLIPGGQS